MDYREYDAGMTDKRPGPASGEDLRSWIREARERKNRSYPKGSSAILIPFLIRDGAYHVLYEVRAAKLRSQPGEICFPGGRIEEGEDPMETAVREAEEELCIDRSRIEIAGSLDATIGPGAIPLFTYIGILHDYEGTWSRAEVDRVFTLPLKWILTHEPQIYRIRLERRMPGDFPYEYVPGGRDYRWREQYYSVPFYPQVQTELSLFEVPAAQRTGGEAGESGAETEPVFAAESGEKRMARTNNMEQLPVLWGVTARVTHALAQLLRDDRGERIQR